MKPEGAERTNIYLQKVPVTYDTGFLHTVVETELFYLFLLPEGKEKVCFFYFYTK